MNLCMNLCKLNVLRKPTKAVRRLRTNLNILNNVHSELLGQLRLTGDRAKYSMYSILYMDGDHYVLSNPKSKMARPYVHQRDGVV